MSASEKGFLEKIETRLRTSIPKYLKNLIELTGYDSYIGLSTISLEDITYIESFGSQELPNLVTERNNDFFGIYYKNPENFKIVNGHKKILLFISEELKKKECKDYFEKCNVNVQQKRKISNVINSNSSTSTKIVNDSNQAIKTTEDNNAVLNKLVRNWLINFCNYMRKHFEKVETEVGIPTQNRAQNHTKLNTIENGLQSLTIEIVENKKATVKCLLCEYPLKVMKCTLRNGQENWVLSNFNRHIKNHFKNKCENINKSIESNLVQPLLLTFFKSAPSSTPHLSAQASEIANNTLNDKMQDNILEQSHEFSNDEVLANCSITESITLLSDEELIQTEIQTQTEDTHFLNSKTSVEATSSCSNVNASFHPKSFSEEKLTKPEINPVINKKYSRADRNISKLAASVDDSQTLITNYYSVLDEVGKLMKENTELKQMLSKSQDTIQNYNGPTDLQHQTANVIKLLHDTNFHNFSRSEKGNRYAKNLKLFSTYLYLIGGNLLYETIQANLKNALPSLTTVKRNIESYNSVIEGDVRMSELKQFLVKRNLPLHVWISEDQTAVSNVVQYDPKTNNLVGFVLPLTHFGLPEKNIFLATTANQIENFFNNSKKSVYVNVIVAQPLMPNSPSFCLCIYGTDNKFTSKDAYKRWKKLESLAQEQSIIIHGFSSDGDTRLLKCMKIRSNFPRFNNDSELKWFQMNYNSKDPISVQDTVHIGTKLKTRLLNSKITMTMGNFNVSVTHLLQLIKTVSKEKHLLTESDLDVTDKMNFEAIDKLSRNNVQTLLNEHCKDSLATVIYLKITRLILDSFLDKEISILTRVYNIWYAVFVLRIWRYWLSTNKKYSIAKNFITLNSYTCIELNAHALILLIDKYRSYKDSNTIPPLFLPWLMSSQPCEKVFRAVRSLTSTFSTVVNFSVLEILRRLKRIQLLNEIMIDISKTSDGNSDVQSEKFIFPREERSSRLGRSLYNSLTSSDIPNYEKVNNEVMRAKVDAIKTTNKLGMQCADQINEEWMQVTVKAESLSNFLQSHVVDEVFDCPTDDEEGEHDDENNVSNEEKLEEQLPVTDKVNIIELLSNVDDLQLKDFSQSLTAQENIETTPYVKVDIKGNIKIIKKSTLCWLLSNNRKRVSTDRLYRFKTNVKPTTLPKRRLKNNKKNESKNRASSIDLLESESSDSESSISKISIRSDTLTESFSSDEGEDDNNVGLETSLNQSRDKIDKNLELEKYYAVYYEENWYIGRIIKIQKKEENNTILMKFLKKNLHTYIWPNVDDIQTIEEEYIFYGPINLVGNGPFEIKRCDTITINRMYKNLKKVFT